MKRRNTDFCEGCCYRKTCEHELEKCCYLQRKTGKCILQGDEETWVY